jgi:hypothetical protein
MYFKHLQHAIGRVTARILGPHRQNSNMDHEKWSSSPSRLSNMGG